ncbi:hypothetical protein AB0C10_15800 [Microbispora amethystogenes]|uniref:hypothetical protein n=1 Tax=Microbispora amethystogenes TaxID=1427754 RepID=UPI0033FD4656
MARTDLPVVQMTRAGFNLAAASGTTANASGGNAFLNNGRRMVRLQNTDSAAKTVTVQIPGSIEGQDLPDRTYNVPATSGDVLIPPLPGIYNQNDGKVYLDYDTVTGLKVTVLELPAG